jgi:hypothetical protein
LTSVLGVDLDPDAEYAAREADLFDTTEIASVQVFVAAVEGMAVGTGVAGQGAELQAVLDRLPKRNHAMGAGKTKVRIIKALKHHHLLARDFRESGSRLNNALKLAYAGNALSHLP